MLKINDKSSKFILILFISGLFSSNASISAEYYVDNKSGSNCSNSDTDPTAGTIEKPWCKIHIAASNALAGDTVYVRSGTYDEESGDYSCFDGAVECGTLNPKNNGNEVDGPITFKAYPSERPIVKGSNSTRYAVMLDGRSYITIDGFEITEGYMGVRFASGHYLTISNNVIHDNDGNRGPLGNNLGGISIFFNNAGDATDIIIDGNEIYSNLDSGVTNGGVNSSGIHIYSASRVDIKRNIIHDEPNGIKVKGQIIGSGWNGLTEDIIIHGNTIYNVTEGIGINHQGIQRNILVYKNTLYNFSWYALGVHSNGSASQNFKFYNNTAVCPGAHVGFLSRFGDDYDTNIYTSNVELFNNIFYQCGDGEDGGKDREISLPQLVNNFTENNNALFDSDDSTYFTYYFTGGSYDSYTLSAWQDFWKAQGSSNGSDDIITDPQFRGKSPHDYLLLDTSTVIDKGKIIDGFHCAQSDTDNPNQTNCLHWVGSAPDIGAHENGLTNDDESVAPGNLNTTPGNTDTGNSDNGILDNGSSDNSSNSTQVSGGCSLTERENGTKSVPIFSLIFLIVSLAILRRKSR